ncbi:ABC transporter ATP-binding protein [Bradyrhizobium sp. NAS80.1]|uniref:ABC transporter ATP-binding protein n=1 Tax=Bradyrhizobium sp. NAS80.1 TaxID=1680159 RepID=UPI00095D1146|nr:ABC transporter ATP-binding protein [Bradyrhizobium sp. NAS80.1]OKO86280.1 ABC transporter ATP-binding protein [Bradyrhizobium sp. NAS80.1]
MLDVSGLSVSYGMHVALAEAVLKVDRGEVVVLLGANGAGKSSLIKALAGLVRYVTGAHIRLGATDLTRLAPHQIVGAGLACVPEGRGVFGSLSVRENLTLGAYSATDHVRFRDRNELVLALFPKLKMRLRQSVQTMSGGEQQMVAIGRALMSGPVILLLDEPSLGLSPAASDELFAAIRRIADLGTGVLMVEQNARRSFAIADRAYLLENGAIVRSGNVNTFLDDRVLIRAYLGGD